MINYCQSIINIRICLNGALAALHRPLNHPAKRGGAARTRYGQSRDCYGMWVSVACDKSAAMGLGRVKTKSDLVVVPSGRQNFCIFLLSTADIASRLGSVRFTPESGQRA